MQAENVVAFYNQPSKSFRREYHNGKVYIYIG
jgi:hypothetical protein